MTRTALVLLASLALLDATMYLALLWLLNDVTADLAKGLLIP